MTHVFSRRMFASLVFGFIAFAMTLSAHAGGGGGFTGYAQYFEVQLHSKGWDVQKQQVTAGTITTFTRGNETFQVTESFTETRAWHITPERLVEILREFRSEPQPSSQPGSFKIKIVGVPQGRVEGANFITIGLYPNKAEGYIKIN